MILRALLLFLGFLFAPAAIAQPVPNFGLRDSETCASQGSAEDPSDIDIASCKPFRSFDGVDSQNRIMWVRGHVDLPKGYPGPVPLGVHTGALAAREIWWNGQRIGAIGKVGASRETEEPGDLDGLTWIPPDLIRAGPNTLAIRYSTFSLDIPVSSPLHYIFIGPIGPSTVNMLAAYGPGLAATGALIAAALFFGVAFVMNTRVLGSLFISLMSVFAVGQLWLESVRGFTSYPYPVQVWRLTGIAVLAFAFALCMTAYVAGRFAPLRWRIYVAVAGVVGLALVPIMPGFDGKTFGFILGPSVVALAAALHGLFSRRPGAISATVALVIFLVLQLVENAGFLNRTFYLAISFIALALFVDQVIELRRARTAEEQANRRAAMLELELLRRRIAPHFLMNTLNALTEWVESDPRTGVKMIEALAGEFRLLSQISDRPLIPLSEEIALCRHHLEVMSYRVDKPFSLVTHNIDESAGVPPGVLHTLVENAFTHGRFEDGGEFVLTRETSGSGDRLMLVTPGAAPAETPKEQGGEGLAYVRRRLEAAFGVNAQVESGAFGTGWRTILTIPNAAGAA